MGIKFHLHYFIRVCIPTFLNALGATMRAWTNLLGLNVSQKTMSLSACEAKYTAVMHTGEKVIWLTSLLEDLRLGSIQPTTLLSDS